MAGVHQPHLQIKAASCYAPELVEYIILKRNSVYLHMLLQLENTDPENINKLLLFARENHLELSVVDDHKNNYFLPGKPLSPHQLTQLIESSRKSGMISFAKCT